jgi:hypothetical protein
MGKSMVGEDSIEAAAGCVERQLKGNPDHARAHKSERMSKDHGDSDMAKVRKLDR